MSIDPIPFTDQFCVVNNTQDSAGIIIDDIINQYSVAGFVIFRDMDDFCANKLLFDRGALGKKPSYDKGDPPIILCLQKDTIPFPIMNCPLILPDVILGESCFMDNVIGDEVKIRN